jgi:hypothetical protein
LLVSSSALLAQTSPAANRVFVEGLGSGIVWSVNYERTVSEPFTLRVGAGGLPTSGLRYVLAFVIPGAQVGDGAHRLVVGAGLGMAWFQDVWVFERTDVVQAYGVGTLGYQYQPRARGVFLRASFTPIVTGQDLAPWGGASVGVAF